MAARPPMPAPQMIETPAMRRSAMLAQLLEQQRQPVEIKGGYGELAARLLGQGITQFSANRAERKVRDEREATRDAFLAGLPGQPEASSTGQALAAALVAPVAPGMGSALPDAAPAGMSAPPMPIADVPPMPQAPAPAPQMAPQAAPAEPQMPPQLVAYIRQLAQTDLAGAQNIYGQWQQQQALMSQLPEAIRNDPVAAWAATQAPAEVAESYGMRYRPTTTAAGSITSYGPGQNDPRVGTPVIERFDDRYGAIDPLNPQGGVQYTAPRGMTAEEQTDRYRVENPTVPANSRVVNLPTGGIVAEGMVPLDPVSVPQGGFVAPFNRETGEFGTPIQGNPDVPAGGGSVAFDATTRGALQAARNHVGSARSRIGLAREFIALNARNPTGIGAAGPLGMAARLNPAYDRMDSISASLIPKEREPGSGPMSDKDIALYGRAQIGIGRPGPANQAIAEAAIAQSERDIEYSAFLDEYAQRNGNIVGSTEDWQAYVNAYPLLQEGDDGLIELRPRDQIQSWRDFMGFGERQRGGSQSRAGPAQSGAPDPLEGRTATGPNGERLVRRGGQWVRQ